jgi:ATP-grasp domain
MGFGVCRWLSCSRGIWESLTVGTQRDLALIMLQAPPIGRGVLDYLFALLPEDAQRGRARHALVEIDDMRDLHLSEKLLARTSLLARLRTTLDLARKHGHQIEGLSCYSSSPRMAELAGQLRVELIDARPALLAWGTKSGSRQVFRQTGVRHPAGSYEASTTIEELATTLNELTLRFGHGRWMVKADYGFGSGHGNAIVDTADLPVPLTAPALVRALRPCTRQVSVTRYVDQIASVGVIAEQVVAGGPDSKLQYPSALGYLRRNDDGQVGVEFLGVHDQLLGESGDYIGCRFPANPTCRALVTEAARKVLAELAAHGVTGHVGVDFVAAVSTASVAPDAIYATEVNLRQTGTTHPHRMVRALVPGHWNSSGTLTDLSGREVYYKGTDSIISPRYVGISSTALIERLQVSPLLRFNQRARRGVVPHLWPALEHCGKLGATFIAPSPAECDALEDAFTMLLEDLAHKH